MCRARFFSAALSNPCTALQSRWPAGCRAVWYMSRRASETCPVCAKLSLTFQFTVLAYRLIRVAGGQ